MEWTPSIAADLARYGCPRCQATGRVGSIEPKELCSCVYREVFRACYRRFKFCGEMRGSVRKVSFERVARAVDRTMVWTRRAEDFRADFHACGLRCLPRHFYQYFSFHYLHGGSQELVSRRLGISLRRAEDWKAEIETLVGREIAHLQPYSLFPPKGYMIPARRAHSMRMSEYRDKWRQG